LDFRFDMELSLVTVKEFNQMELSKYSSLILVDGKYEGISSTTRDKLNDWIKLGGNVIAIKKGAKWLSDQSIGKAKFKKVESDSSQQKQYKDLIYNFGAQVIGGAIFAAEIDISHPLGYGYDDPKISLFRNSTLFFETPDNPYAYPIRYTNTPLQSGYVSKQNLNYLRNTPGVVVSAWGKGKIISFSDNPNFRAYWYGTTKIFMNSLFFGHIIDAKAAK